MGAPACNRRHCLCRRPWWQRRFRRDCPVAGEVALQRFKSQRRDSEAKCIPAHCAGTLYRLPVYKLHSNAARSSTRHGLQTVDGIDLCNSTLTTTSRQPNAFLRDRPRRVSGRTRPRSAKSERRSMTFRTRTKPSCNATTFGVDRQDGAFSWRFVSPLYVAATRHAKALLNRLAEPDSATTD